MPYRHFSMWPLQDAAICGAEQEFQTTELDLVTCQDCRRLVVMRELVRRPA